MSRRRTIKYGIDMETGYAVSQMGDEVAYAVLDYDKTEPAKSGWSEQPMPQHLEKTKIWYVAGWLGQIRWTRAVPLQAKNMHRRFWGLKPLPV